MKNHNNTDKTNVTPITCDVIQSRLINATLDRFDTFSNELKAENKEVYALLTASKLRGYLMAIVRINNQIAKVESIEYDADIPDDEFNPYVLMIMRLVSQRSRLRTLYNLACDEFTNMIACILPAQTNTSDNNNLQ